MNNLLKNTIISIFAVMLLTSTFILGVQNGINTVKIENSVDEKGSVMQKSNAENDNGNLLSGHPIIQIAEATQEIGNEIESEGYTKKIDYNKEVDSHPSETGSEIGSDLKPTPSQSGKVNEVTIKAQKLPNGQYAYQMLKHILYDGESAQDLTKRYSKIPTIPGPSIEMTHQDLLILHSIDETGLKKTQEIRAEKPGTFEYYGEHYRTLGLFGALIINPIEKVPALINGKVVNVNTEDLEKQYVLFMVGSTFWGQEIDSNHIQKPLWTNPTLGADLNQLVRFHILGAAHQHTFHLHAHRWLDPGTTNIIDTKLIDPQSTHWFIVEAGDKVGIGTWQYHCHVFAHMEAGMMGGFKVGPAGSDTPSLPGVSPLIEFGSSSNESHSNTDTSKSEKSFNSQGNFITFDITDEPGQWFRNVGGEILPGITKSLGVVENQGTAHFIMSSTNTVHTITSLLWPTDAQNMPYDQLTSYRGGGIVQLEKPGLYIFTCKIHPYMMGAMIVDDPKTKELDLGDKLTLNTRAELDLSEENGLATASALLRTFFIANNPNNWQDYSGDNPIWNMELPNIDIKFGDEKRNLKTFLLSPIGENDVLPLDAIQHPSKPGIGEVWIDTQFEKTANKSKPGSATQVNVGNWQVERKVALPQINLNNPHNMWSDSQQDVIYQTEWFDNRITAFDRHSGKLLDDMKVGEAPSHVITNPINDLIYVTLSGEEGVAELKFNKDNNKFELLRIIPMQELGQNPTSPDGLWITPDGRKMITPNHFTDDTSITSFSSNLKEGELQNRTETGHMPIAIGMMPDGNTAYVSNFLSSTIDVIDMNKGTVIQTIDLPDKGNALPIQTPVSPDGQYVVTANTLTATISIIDTDTNKIVKTLSCDPGCHGVNFGAKEGGGYYAYVSSKFSNRMIVVDGDPNNDGNPDDAKIAGSVLLTGKYGSDGSPRFNTDDEILKYKGMGGQGVYPIPNVNPGWVEKLGLSWNLTSEQRDPITSFHQLNGQTIQANNNEDTTKKDSNSESTQPQQESTTSQLNSESTQPQQESTTSQLNSESTQPQQESTTSQLIEKKLSELQQQSVTQALDPNMISELRDPITSFNQLNGQTIQANNNENTTKKDSNSESTQPQQESTTSQLIEKKLSELQQQSVTQALDPNMVSEQSTDSSLEKLKNIISSLPVPSP